MRCKMCGAKLKKEGNICKNCYQIYKKEQKLMLEDEEEVLRIKRKYSPGFNAFKNFDLIMLLIITSLAGLSGLGILLGILVTILCIIIFGIWMFFNKKRAKGSTTIFYQTKFKYKAKYPFRDYEEAVAYSDIKDISYFQTYAQKKFGVGDIRFYKKNFLSGITINDIPNVKENFEKIKDIINSTR